MSPQNAVTVSLVDIDAIRVAVSPAPTLVIPAKAGIQQ